MSTYIEYKIDGESTVLVETEAPMSSIVKASRGGLNVVQAGKNFADAMASIRGSLKALISEMNALEVEEADVKFGLKAVGEAGVFAVGKVGGEMNYEVTWKWKRPAVRQKQKTRK